MYRLIFKTGARTFSGIGALLIINNNIPKSFCEKQKLSFDTKGLDYELNSFTTNEEMLLTGVGMRKLNFLITEFNVYLAGIHLNKNALSFRAAVVVNIFYSLFTHDSPTNTAEWRSVACLPMIMGDRLKEI